MVVWIIIFGDLCYNRSLYVYKHTLVINIVIQHYLSVLFLHIESCTLLFGFHISHCLSSYEPYSIFTFVFSYTRCLALTAVTVHNLSALAARDLDKFLVSVGRQPSYVDLEVIFFSALLIFHCLLVFICIYIPFVG